MPEMTNENVKKMAELLRSGNTMLNRSCPICNTPIFRNQEGSLFCPTCNREVQIVNQDSQKKEQNESKSSIQSTDKELLSNKKELIDKTLKILNDKVNFLLSKIESETQINQLREFIHLLKKFYDLIYYLNKI